ncbi:MATE efflux family protein 1-like [Dorcoceras hygrometricum]|uniref:MATE efflux family protein 1-like n=1 Tax=Dorcoceras hygrometricum TaxID=472368 RepID=A0A2Z7B2E0_9LAMI|nr:MATE efflux family protein 1-like [Dorcoceras hygrometricum]
MVSSEIDSMKSELLVESVIKSGLIGDDCRCLKEENVQALGFMAKITDGPNWKGDQQTRGSVVPSYWMFKGRKCSGFRIYGKDNRRSKLEGRSADERVGCPFILALLAEPLGSLAFLVQVSPRRSRWEVELEPVAAC